MPISETGHARNIQHFQSLISFVTGYGGVYKPTNPSIELPNLIAALLSATMAMDDVTTSLGVSKTAINARETAFEPLQKLTTRTVNFYASTGAEQNAIDDARSFQRKLAGKRKTPATTDDPSTPGDESAASHSASQQSYTQKVEHLDNLISLYQGDPLYKPNETELSIAGLNAHSGQLKAANTAVIDSYTQLSNKRVTRDVVMYGQSNGLFDRAALVKKYVKALFGASSPEFKQISGLKFTSKIK